MWALRLGVPGGLSAAWDNNGRGLAALEGIIA